MANQNDNFGNFVNALPVIHVIPPTPDVPSRDAITTEARTATVWQQEGNEIKDPDCNECVEESRDKSADVVMDVDSQSSVQPSERERNENEVFRNISVGNYYDRCMRVLTSFNESKFMLFFQFLLLILPISAGFMGAKYLDKCPLSSETPVFLFMMGIAGTIVIICRILLISQKILLPTHREWQVLRVIVIVGNLAIIVCFTTEMFSFFRTVPSFEIGSAHYCHQTFYKYTYWTNWTCLIVITFLTLLQLPYCSVVALQDDDIL